MRTVILVVGFLACNCAGPSIVRGSVLRLDPCGDPADGMELNDAFWRSDGLPEYHGNLALGLPTYGIFYEPAFMFQVNGLARGDSIAYARLRFTTLGGDLVDTLQLRFRGLYHCTSQPFGQNYRPSQIQPTEASVVWNLLDPWIYGEAYDPLFTFGPDLSPVVNEILSSECWPTLPQGAFLSLAMDVPHVTSRRSQLCKFGDTGTPWPPVQLEIYTHLEDAFLVPPVLGRVESNRATVSFTHLATVDCYVAYGLASGTYLWAQGATRTLLPEVDPIPSVQGGLAREIDLDEMDADTQYFGRLYFRRPGRPELCGSQEFTFHTQRPPEASFRFDIVADSHLEMKQDAHLERDVSLYGCALRNVHDDAPDFWVGLGDFAVTLEAGNGVRSLQEARRIYMDARRFEAEAAGAIPFYFVLGNHEGEVGWLDYGGDGIYRWSTQARAEFVANPRPDPFFAGPAPADSRAEPPEDYYAWEWGDALFVVLDPFRPTREKPHHYGGGGSGDGWDWTLGPEQYEWLYQVLSTSARAWKFVFLHHLTGGVPEEIWGPYGRGGTEAVRYAVDGRPSFEWGGEDSLGQNVFAQERPGWTHGPIHDLLRDHDVTVVFHAHDHCYVRQTCDGITYQACPMPSDATYGPGLWGPGAYSHGTRLHNSGHLRVTVSSGEVRIEYVRAYLPGEGENQRVEDEYVLYGGPCPVALPAAVVLPGLRLRPNPAPGRVWIEASYPGGAPARLSILDATGRMVCDLRLPALPPGSAYAWEPSDASGRPLSSGVYQVWLHAPDRCAGQRLLIVR